MGNKKDRELIYDREITDNFDTLHREHQKILNWVNQNEAILEVGCHSGYLSKWFKDKNCSVIGIDLDEKALQKASLIVDKTIHGNIDDPATWTPLKGKKFNCITFMHILEHTINPWKILKSSTSLLERNGHIIISLPNICNIQNRFSIFKGNFDYEDVGVMDRTHLRFFNLKTATDLIESSGLVIEEYYSPIQLSVTKCILDELPLLHKIGSKLTHKKKGKYSVFSNNITDQVMTFKCRLK